MVHLERCPKQAQEGLPALNSLSVTFTPLAGSPLRLIIHHSTWWKVDTFSVNSAGYVGPWLFNIPQSTTFSCACTPEEPPRTTGASIFLKLRPVCRLMDSSISCHGRQGQ
eukprot:4614952-Amphidinium_carterae.1